MFFVIDTILNAVFFYEKPESYSPFLFVTKPDSIGTNSLPLETPMDMIKLFYQRYHLVAVQFV